MANQIPHSYTGYGDETDDTGNVTSAGTKLIIGPEKAKDANEEWVNPKEVADAIDKLKDVLTGTSGGITRIKSALENVAVDADGNMLSVEDATMEPVIEESAESLNQIGPALEPEFDEILANAQKMHDEKQQEFNQEKEQEIKEYPGVTKVVQS